MKLDKKSFKESFSDTVLGTLVNFPMNFLLISFAFHVKMNAFETTLFCTSILFLFAVARKYMVRLHFKGLNNE
jgi:uncharacterized integral membrane protein